MNIESFGVSEGAGFGDGEGYGWGEGDGEGTGEGYGDGSGVAKGYSKNVETIWVFSSELPMDSVELFREIPLFETLKRIFGNN